VSKSLIKASLAKLKEHDDLKKLSMKQTYTILRTGARRPRARFGREAGSRGIH